ncbi:hypothetical protein PCANC_22653 [Puccinia coronata f. sp. avenae]|uniref:Uncharacterized protein n=1 Tax=Puccinia coronata f. sp. avenae TaxID=200324 RepID=A0A2N5SBS1_9BASI|nr:hypothetical protein PCANC_22653 [Puccinia coronata f. sp. avenae]
MEESRGGRSTAEVHLRQAQPRPLGSSAQPPRRAPGAPRAKLLHVKQAAQHTTPFRSRYCALDVVGSPHKNLTIPVYGQTTQFSTCLAQVQTITTMSALTRACSFNQRDERVPFKALHPHDTKDSFASFFNAAGLAKVRQYHDELDELFEHVTSQYMSSTIANSAKKKNAVISKFIRLAHFKRFPKGDNSKLTDQVMLAALERPICPSDTQDLADKPQKIRFELDIIKAGHHAEYKKSDVIIDPILNNLRTWANRWSPSTFRAPYTFIPGNLYEHYSRFLGVVLETAAEFFSRPAMREMEEEDKLQRHAVAKMSQSRYELPQKFRAEGAPSD